MKLTGNQIRYLLTIKKLSETKHVIKGVDVAKELNYSRASVHKMMVSLKELDYVKQEYYSSMKLTPNGLKLAKMYEKKYDIIKKTLEPIIDIPDSYNLGICHLIELM